MLTACQHLADPLPITPRGQLPAAAQPYLPVVSGQVGEAMGFSAPRCDQTSLTFPQRLPALAGGYSPAHSSISKPTALFTALFISGRLGRSERTWLEPAEEAKSSPGAQQGGGRTHQLKPNWGPSSPPADHKVLSCTGTGISQPQIWVLKQSPALACCSGADTLRGNILHGPVGGQGARSCPHCAGV